VAIELLCAAQAVDLRGVALPEALAPVYQMVRDVAPTLESDRAIGDDIERVRQAIVQGDR
jgi:histidine ammonia-lyase